MKSSLSYQLLLYLGSYYCVCFISIEVLLLIYKCIILPYQNLTLASEVTFYSYFKRHTHHTSIRYLGKLNVSLSKTNTHHVI